MAPTSGVVVDLLQWVRSRWGPGAPTDVSCLLFHTGPPLDHFSESWVRSSPCSRRGHGAAAWLVCGRKGARCSKGGWRVDCGTREREGPRAGAQYEALSVPYDDAKEGRKAAMRRAARPHRRPAGRAASALASCPVCESDGGWVGVCGGGRGGGAAQVLAPRTQPSSMCTPATKQKKTTTKQHWRCSPILPPATPSH
jgi:hypothetical protein